MSGSGGPSNSGSDTDNRRRLDERTERGLALSGVTHRSTTWSSGTAGREGRRGSSAMAARDTSTGGICARCARRLRRVADMHANAASVFGPRLFANEVDAYGLATAQAREGGERSAASTVSVLDLGGLRSAAILLVAFWNLRCASAP